MVQIDMCESFLTVACLTLTVHDIVVLVMELERITRGLEFAEE
jgi:hypothetical protein